MRIKKIIAQYRRDMVVRYECESCGEELEGQAYDDKNFHENVIPEMVCKKCGKKAPEDYRPLATKYREEEMV